MPDQRPTAAAGPAPTTSAKAHVSAALMNTSVFGWLAWNTRSPDTIVQKAAVTRPAAADAPSARPAT